MKTRRSREDFEAICDSAPDTVLLVDSEGHITFANARVSEMFGYEPEELVDEPIEVLVPEPYKQTHVAQRDAYLEGPETRPMGADLDLTARRKDGSTFPIDISLSPIDSGEHLEVMAVVRDISEQEGLRTKYRTILEAVPDAVVVADIDSGEIVEVNDQVTDLFGYTPEELVGQPQTALHPSGEEDRYRELFEEHITSGKAIFTQLPDGGDIHIETKDGDIVPVEINAHVFELDDQRLIAGVFRDITRRKEYERQLGTLHETTRQLLQANDREVVAEIVTEAAKSVLGFASTVVRLADDGTQLRPVAVTEGARTAIGPRPTYSLGDDSPVSRAYENGEPQYIDDVCDLEDGFDRGTVKSAMYLPMGKHGVLSIVASRPAAFDQTDIELATLLAANAETALDRLADEQELKRQNHRLDEFVNVVSHDLRNPLSVATGWLEVAQEDIERRELDRIGDALDRMDAIIDDTLTLARQGETVAEMEPIAMAHLAGDCWEMVSTADAQLELADEFTFRGDRNRLRHVIENLFRNAVEHSGEDVTITIGALDGGFYVEDDGPGIPEAERDKVFEPGFSSSEEGTGFGLSIVKQVADAHSWDVRVTEGSDGGARFEITGVEFAAE